MSGGDLVGVEVTWWVCGGDLVGGCGGDLVGGCGGDLVDVWR